MEVEGETGNKRKGKFRSCRRKKRKGFHGKKAWEVRMEAEENDRNDTSVESHVEPQPSTSKAQSEYDDFLDRTAPKNMSELKLMNSSFENFDRQEAVTTRSQSSSAEICVHEEAHGFKLQDAKLLSECFAVSAICSSCRNSKSKLQLFQDSASRNGLAELMYLKCSYCGIITPLNTSTRLGGKGGGPHEVNRRSVLSSHQWGRAGLAKFCAGMELPPPVTKKAYNQHMKQVEKLAVSNAETLMCEAAERLRQLASHEDEECEVEIDGQSVCKVAFSIDGTWQKRGHSSKIGVAFAVSVMTGEIIDYEVKSLICINGQLCSRCPKSRYCGKRRVVIAVCETVGVFNTGAASKASLLESCGISPGRNMLKALKKEDQERIASAAHKISSKYRKRRQTIRSMKNSKADKLAYQAGAFGTSFKPETDGRKKKKNPPKKKKSTVALPAPSSSSGLDIVFVVPDVEFVAKERTEQK